jgi:hypothetical protein
VFAVDSSVDVVRRTILAAGPEAVRLTATVEGFATYAVPPRISCAPASGCRSAGPRTSRRVVSGPRGPPAGLDADIIEEERDGEAFSGPKHWHVFNVVARRPLVDESA